jgi:thiol:disulfide interchange protein
MRNIYKLFLLLTFISGFTNIINAQVNWDNSNFDKIIIKAASLDKLVMIDFYTDWCIPCKQVLKVIFTDDTAIVRFVNNKYICTKINAEKDEGIKLAKKYNVGGFPTILFLDKNKNVIGRIEGTLARDNYFKAIKTAGNSEEKTNNSETKIEK